MFLRTRRWSHIRSPVWIAFVLEVAAFTRYGVGIGCMDSSNRPVTRYHTPSPCPPRNPDRDIQPEWEPPCPDLQARKLPMPNANWAWSPISGTSPATKTKSQDHTLTCLVECPPFPLTPSGRFWNKFPAARGRTGHTLTGSSGSSPRPPCRGSRSGRSLCGSPTSLRREHGKERGNHSCTPLWQERGACPRSRNPRPGLLI